MTFQLISYERGERSAVKPRYAAQGPGHPAVIMAWGVEEGEAVGLQQGYSMVMLPEPVLARRVGPPP